MTVGNPGNAPNYAGGFPWYGAVDNTFQIMKFEFTNSQYAAFLNAIDPAGTNPNSVYSYQMSSNLGGITNTGTTNGSRYAVISNMGDKPVLFASWWDAARVSNWLHNGAQTYGSSDSSASAPQNTGAYTVGTAISGSAVAVNAGAKFYVPTENQWYKAAYYNPTLNSGSGGYTTYGNGFSSPAPTAVTAGTTGIGSAGGSGNFANYNLDADWNGRTNGNLTTVGTNGGPSYYGAFDMSGNVWEWNDLTGGVTALRGRRGGDYSSNDVTFLSSSVRLGVDTSSEIFDPTGFRLATVPEPSTWAMALAGLACGGFSMWRRRRQT